MKLFLLFFLAIINAKVFIDESQTYFTDLRKLNDLVQNNEQLLTCFFERDFQLDSTVSCVDKNSLDLLQKHFAGHLDNIIKLSLKQQPDCYHLNDENKASICQEFLKAKVVEKTNFPIESDEEKQVLDQIVNIVLKTFKKLQKEKEDKLEIYKKQPFLKNINDYIKNDLIANLVNKPSKVVEPIKKPSVQKDVKVKENKIVADVKKDQFEENFEISQKEKEEIKKLQSELQEDFDVHAYEDQFQLKNSVDIDEDQFKRDLKEVDDESNQIMANLVFKIEELQKQKEIKQNEKINLKFKNYESDPEQQIDTHIRGLTKLYNKTSSHINLIRKIEEQMMDLFYKMLLFRNRQVPEGTTKTKQQFFQQLQHEIYDLKEHIDNDIVILDKHLSIIKSNSNIVISQPQVEYQFEQYLNNEIPDSKYYDDLRRYLGQVRKIKSDYELIRSNYQSQINELREQINDLKLWQKMIDNLNNDIIAIENKIQSAKKKQYKILSIGIEEERITKVMDEMTLLDKDRIKKMKLVGTLKHEVENLRKTNIIKAVESIKEAIQQQNEILNNEHNDKDRIVQEIQQSINSLKERMEQVKDEPLLL